MTKNSISHLSLEQNLDSMTQLNEEQASLLLGLSKKWLQKKRYTGGGPKYIKISSRCIRYRIADIRVWQDENLMHSTAEQALSQ